MKFAKVTGNVVSTQKDQNAEGWKMLLVQPLDINFKPKGDPMVAVDAVGAGVDEMVLICSGSSARQTDITKNKPCDLVIMGIIDSVEQEGEIIFRKFETEGFR
ncbi:MAG: EutN/CcmL family microcompartment protein [Vulcanimicrobiota bacterium]